MYKYVLVVTCTCMILSRPIGMLMLAYIPGCVVQICLPMMVSSAVSFFSIPACSCLIILFCVTVVTCMFLKKCVGI